MSIIKCLLLCILYNHFAESFNFTLLHNNDLHSHFAQVNVWSSPCDNSSSAKGQCFGGFARIIAKVKEIKDSQKTKVLFLNAGDSFQGTVWYSLYKWEIVAQFIKIIKFDATTIGNHEFDDGVDGFAPFVDAIAPHLPIVSCNIDASNEPKLNNKFHKSVVLEVDNHKIGVIGYTTPDTTFLAVPGKTLTFNDEIECIKKEVELLKKQGIKILIGLGHSGLVKDIEIAQKVPELDVVVGGHSHSFLYSGPKPSVEEIVDKYPVVVNHGSHITLVVQAFAFSKYLGRLDLQFNENGDIYRYDGKPILLDQKMPEDAITAKMVAEYDIKIKQKYGDVIGKTNVLLEGGVKCLMGECKLGNLITDAMVEFYIRKSQKQTHGSTDNYIAVHNGGGIRSTIDDKSKNGSITLEDILSVIPFGNDIVMLVMSGKVVKDMLEHSVTKYDVTGRAPNGRFLQVSGLRVYFDLNKPELQRVTEVYVRFANCRAPEYKPLNETQTYKVIVPKYLADGGDDYTMLKQKDVQLINSQDLDYQIVSDYIREKSPISQGYENRLNLKYNNLFISGASQETRTVNVIIVSKYRCTSIIPRNNQSQIVKITCKSEWNFTGSCETWDFGPPHTIYNATFTDGSVQQINRITSIRGLIPSDDNQYSLSYGTLSGACSGDSYGRFSKYPLNDLRECRDSKCQLFETYTTSAYLVIIGSSCSFNICIGYNKQLFPQGLN